MQPLPPITVSSLDLARLEYILSGVESDQAGSLLDELERATVVEPADVPPTVVTMNSTVRFAFEGSGDQLELTLCYPKDAGQPGHVSVLAPIGAALLGLSVGDTIEWPVPSGETRRVTILELTYQPERAGDMHR